MLNCDLYITAPFLLIAPMAIRFYIGTLVIGSLMSITTDYLRYAIMYTKKYCKCGQKENAVQNSYWILVFVVFIFTTFSVQSHSLFYIYNGVINAHSVTHYLTLTNSHSTNYALFIYNDNLFHAGMGWGWGWGWGRGRFGLRICCTHTHAHTYTYTH